MTKQDFIALADAIRAHNSFDTPTVPGYPVFQACHIKALADFCQGQNPAFNRDRWLGYIAGTNGKNGGIKK